MHTSAVPGNATSHALSSGEEIQSSLAGELERAKEDLELVSYVTSHDLQAPLRNILSSCEELKKHLDGAADKEGQLILKSLSGEASRMKTLMQGLLDYLRLETYGPTHSMLDCNEVVDAALTILDDKIRDGGAKITCDSLPQVYGHRGRMTRLFVNLLDNALKFHEALPVIRISARNTRKELEFHIEDNGIGIDEEYHEIIFGLFQRLHAADAYTGEGIGLALSRKIIESHGGRLWVESAPGKGSCFRFTLPIVQEGK